MGCRSMALLLLTLAVAAALPSSSAAAGGRGARTGSSMEAISIQDTDAVFFPSPAQDQEEGPTGTESITSTLKSARAASRESSFTPEAYPVKWNHKRDHNPPHGGVAAQQNSFTTEPYPTWSLKEDPSPSLGGTATEQSSFMPEAYPVKWNHKRDYNPPHVSIASQRNSFTPEAYPVKWNHKRDHNPPHGGFAAQQNSFTTEPYPTWSLKEDPSPSLGGTATQQSSFTPEAYPVKWNHKRDHNPPHVGVATQRDSFTPEAYPVKWNHKRDPSSSLGGVATQQSSFIPEAYPVKWNHKRDELMISHSAPYVAETTLAAGHDDDDLHVATGMLFRRKSLFPGAVLPEGTKFAGNGFPDPRRFVSREDADVIPFSYKQVDTILRTLGIPRGSKKADQVAATLRTCEAESPDPEPHTCATSEQAELDFAASSLATRTSELRAIVTVVHGEKDAARYMVAPNGVARIGKAGGGGAMVPCHMMAYPYMVHYCHRSADVEALHVELMGLGDDHDHAAAAAAASGATAIAMCHANTTSWDGRYFQMLNATRGEEICHFMPRNYVLWLTADAL